MLCTSIETHFIIGKRANPLVTIVDPLPIPGTTFGVNFGVQLSRIEVDFHPGSRFTLPPELGPPLGAQRLAIRLQVCGGIGCPPRDLVDRYIPPPPPPPKDRPAAGSPNDGVPVPPGIVVIPTRSLQCFCLEAYAVGGVRIRSYNGRAWLEPFLDGVEIVDIRPEGLENSLECYLEMILKLSVLPKLRMLLDDVSFELMRNVNVALKPMPTSGALPNNPAIEKDLLKAFIKVEV
ncbi:MAG: hypothetical protein H6509_04120 [Bryobacterales bacterium]|nr:hypothetical protein [Bryobacterales bacterium]